MGGGLVQHARAGAATDPHPQALRGGGGGGAEHQPSPGHLGGGAEGHNVLLDGGGVTARVVQPHRHRRAQPARRQLTANREHDWSVRRIYPRFLRPIGPA
eukprot:1183941-Prorocentrum_minimum.AAC.2